jgi:hypothetical protein
VERDLRIDFIRGLALVCIYIDHIQGNFLASFTLQRFSFIDAAEVFILISGYVCGIVYTSTYLRAGLRTCLAKAMRRCVQIYFAQITLLLASCLILYEFAIRGVYLAHRDPAIYAFLEHPLKTLLAALALAHAPGLAGLLPLYLVFLALTPITVSILCHRPVYVLVCSALIYLVVQLRPEITAYFVYPMPRAWEFNPAAWQLLFVAGLLMGNRKVRRGSVLQVPRWLTGIGVAGLAMIAIVRCGASPVLARLIHTRALQDFFGRFPEDFAYTGKHNFQPLRIVNVILLVLATPLLRRKSRLLLGWLAGCVIRMGSNSLVVYSAGIPLSYAAMAFSVQYRAGQFLFALLTIAGILIMHLVAQTSVFFKQHRALLPGLPAAGWRRRADSPAQL